MSAIERTHYRPEIDGLRAVAVTIVILFHAKLGFNRGFGCTGGFVGVDVFFVISGFLITSIIWRDLENGTFSFSHFWERRARRIVPALAVMTIVTLVAGMLLLLPADLENLGKASLWQSGFGSNIFYYLETDYFNPSVDEKPLLHTWSLAVEEQFYFFAPFVFWILFKSSIGRTRSRMLLLLTAGLLASLGYSQYLLTRDPAGAFYLLPTRAWELLLGSVLAFLPNPPFSPRFLPVANVLALGGLILILHSAFTYHSETAFPGFAAMPPCFGAALIIWANGTRANSKVFPATIVGRLLATQALVFVGLIS